MLELFLRISKPKMVEFSLRDDSTRKWLLRSKTFSIVHGKNDGLAELCLLWVRCLLEETNCVAIFVGP